MTDEASKIKGLLWAVAALALGTLLAVGLAPLIQAVPWSWEQELSSIFPATTNKICAGNAQTNAHLTQLVSRLYPVAADDKQISLNVRIVDDPQINAYAQLGGNIFLNKGLLEKATSAEEIAGVLAHEIEHVKKRHVLENILVHTLTVSGLQMIFDGSASSNGKWLNYFLNMHFSRAQESEADEGGLKRLQIAHIDNQGFQNFFKRLEDDSLAQKLLSDHPENEKRYEMAKSFDNIHSTPVMTPKEWESFKHYCP